MHHVRKQYNRWSFRLSIFGKYVDAGESYDDEVAAGVAADLVKHYLASEYKLVLPPSLDGEMFSSLAYSRRNVDLSSSYSVEKSLAPGAKTFIAEHKAKLEEHRDAQPAPSVYSKFRNSGMISDPRIREWVERCEAAALDSEAFSKINSEYLFRLIDALPGRFTDVLKPLKLALKMHEGVANPRLIARRQALSELVKHVEEDISYAVSFSKSLREEHSQVESAVATLESARPSTV